MALWLRHPPGERKIWGSNPTRRWDFSGSSHTSDSNIGTPVAILLGAWRYRDSTGTGQPGVSILWLGEVESLICNLYLSVVGCRLVGAHPSQRYTGLLLGCWASKQATNKLILETHWDVAQMLSNQQTSKLSRFIPEMHWDVARTVSNQKTSCSIRQLDCTVVPVICSWDTLGCLLERLETNKSAVQSVDPKGSMIVQWYLSFILETHLDVALTLSNQKTSCSIRSCQR